MSKEETKMLPPGEPLSDHESSEYYLYAFGSNGEGQLGIGTREDKVMKSQRCQIMLREAIKDIRGGAHHTLLRTSSGLVFGAGSNQLGQLGYMDRDGNQSSSQACQSTASELSSSQFHAKYQSVSHIAAAVHSSGYIVNPNPSKYPYIAPRIIVEGTGSRHELGQVSLTTTSGLDSLEFPGCVGDQYKQFSPLPFCPTDFKHSVVDFAAGLEHYVLVLSDGSVYGWGKTSRGQLGNVGPDITEPTKLDVPFHAVRVVCGNNFTYVVGNHRQGEHKVLGDDKHGIQSHMPKDILNYKDIGATWYAIFVLFEDGSLQAWGKDNNWELVPRGLPKIDQIAIGSDHVVALARSYDPLGLTLRSRRPESLQKEEYIGPKLISWGWGIHGNCGDLSNLTNPKPCNGMITGNWNVITDIPGEIVKIGAGHSTSFVQTKHAAVDDELSTSNADRASLVVDALDSEYTPDT